jgi:glycerophosphoryl diester phosphodiesterase
MWNQARDIAAEVVRDVRRSWWGLALADIAYKALAFAVLTPATVFFLHWLLARTRTRVVADTDILLFFVTTRPGVVALVLGGAIILAITVLETACLMAIGLAAARGRPVNARSALVFAWKRSAHVLALTANMVVRILVGLVPFLLAIGLVYVALLREHDINFYLAQQPPAFVAAAAITGLILASLAALLVRTVARWALALPIVLFENIAPRRALAESARRSAGARPLIVVVIAGWAAIALALANAARWLPELVGRALAPHFAGSLPQLLLFIAGLALVWAAAVLAGGIVNAALLALAVVALYLRIGVPTDLRVPEPAVLGRFGAPVELSRRMIAGIVALVILVFVGFATLATIVTRQRNETLVIAHRGSSAEAPENTLAAFRLAIEQGADVVELDVQESADGEVLVAHDSDLMKVAGVGLKIWEADAADLRSIDIGSYAGRQFSAERVPTLAEALNVCKGKVHMLIELKSYGHDRHLEESVVAIVEAAGMEESCSFMSLDHHMVGALKRLRPQWRVGVLAAKAFGDLTSLDADFLAVETRMATARFVRRTHRAGQDVYVWTVNDPAWMLTTMSRGVDGLITDRPQVARSVVATRAEMSDTERVLVALLVRLGARTDMLAAEDALRP